MKHDSLEPGLVQLLRLYVIVSAVTVPLFRRMLGAAFGLDGPLESYLWLNLPVILFLVAYFTFPWWQRRLERAFLPVAMIVFAGHAILEKYISLQWFIAPALRELVMLLLMLRLWIVFQLLMLFIAWQYNLFWVTVGSLTVCLLDAALSFPFVKVGGEFYTLYIVIVSVRLFSVTFVAIGLVHVLRHLREQRYALTEANRKLALAATTVEQLAISQERNRLARELHDTLAHSLSGVTVELEAVDALWDVDTHTAHTMLQQASQHARNGLGEARRALQALRANPLEDLGLALAICQLADSAAARAHLKLELDVPQGMDNLSAEVEQSVYRIAQEALANVVRHAQATHLRVALERANGHLTLTIVDNGRGFEKKFVDSTRYGLKGMHERAEIIGGQLDIKSELQKGTALRLTLPAGER